MTMPLIDPYDEDFGREFEDDEDTCPYCGTKFDPEMDTDICSFPDCPCPRRTEDEFERSMRP